jgi:hypothetical protein
VPDRVLCEESLQVAAAAVLHRVVGHQPGCADPVALVEGERALEEGDDGGGLLVVVDLGVGKPGVVVDDRVHDVGAVEVAAVLASTVAGEAVSGLLEARLLGRVHGQQVARAGPRVAVCRLAHRTRWPRDPRPPEHLPDGRMAEAGRACDKPWPQPVWRRQAQIASASSGASRRGERCGRLERSSRHDRVARASSPASSQRCHHRCAVAGDTLKAAAAAFNVIPPAIAATSA